MSSIASMAYSRSNPITTPASNTTQEPVGPLPGLNYNIVDPADLQRPEYCFRGRVDFSKKHKDDAGVSDIKNIITGLLNTSGGNVEISSSSGKRPDARSMDKWKLNLENTLMAFIPYDVCRACIQLYDYSYPLNILVKKSPKLITLNSHLYVRWLAGDRVINDVDCIRDVISMRSGEPFPDPFDGIYSIAYHSNMNIGEGPNVEFKSWNSVEKVDDPQRKNTYISQLEEERTLKTMFSMRNMENGGLLILGVEEDKETGMNRVVGQVISENDKDHFRNYVNSYLSSHSQRYPGDWREGSRELECGRDWTIRFIPVTGGPSEKPRSVIVIRFNHIQGGVWASCPESFFVSEAGHILPMSFDQWRKALNHSTLSPLNNYNRIYTPQIHPETYDALSEQGIDSDQSSKSAEIRKQQTSHTFSVCSNTKPQKMPQSLQIEVTGHPSSKDKNSSATITSKQTIKQNVNDDRTSGRKYISWTQNRSDWQSIINHSGTELEEDILKLAESAKVFNMTVPTNLFPDIMTLLAGQQGNSALLEDALHHISSGTEIKSYGFASTKWIENIQTNMELTEPKYHILDVFVMYETGRVKLWAIVDEQASDFTEIWEYLNHTGRVTKRELLYGQTIFLSNIDLECCLYHLEHGPLTSESSHSNKTFPVTESNKQNELKMCVAGALLRKTTNIRSIFGDNRGIILTAEQMDVILSLGIDQFNFIEGPPGSGKTYIALRLCQQYKCGYMYGNDTFGKFLEYQGVNHRFKAENSEMLRRYIDNNAFEGLQYLIVDDAHSLEFSETTWFSLFEYISAPHRKTKLVIFGDSSYQNFMEETRGPVNRSCQYLLKFCETKNYLPVVKRLSVIHRNHRKIAAFIKSNFENDRNYPEQSKIACSHSEDGDDVEIKHLNDVMCNDEQNSLLSFVQKLTDQQRSLGHEKQLYEPRDVAIMVDTINSENDASKLRSIFEIGLKNKAMVHDAGTFPVIGYTIDTLDNFMGLDRRLCVLLTSEKTLQSMQQSGRSFANPRYRAFVASRGISRIIFVVHTELNTSVASKFKLDWTNIVPVTQKLWHLEQTSEIRDLCFLDIGGRPSVLFVRRREEAGGTDVRVVTMEGVGMLTVESSRIKRFLCTTSSNDRCSFVLAGEDAREENNWCWEMVRSLPEQLERIHTLALDACPRTVTWSHEGHVLILLHKSGISTLVKLSPLDGREIWRRDNIVTRGWLPRSIAVCPRSGMLYVSDQKCIRKLGPDGHHVRYMSIPGISSPYALCIDSTGHYLFVSNFNRTEMGGGSVFIVASDGSGLREVMRTPCRVSQLRLIGDKYLGVATWGSGLFLYDVTGLL